MTSPRKCGKVWKCSARRTGNQFISTPSPSGCARLPPPPTRLHGDRPDNTHTHKHSHTTGVMKSLFTTLKATHRPDLCWHRPPLLLAPPPAQLAPPPVLLAPPPAGLSSSLQTLIAMSCRLGPSPGPPSLQASPEGRPTFSISSFRTSFASSPLLLSFFLGIVTRSRSDLR